MSDEDRQHWDRWYRGTRNRGPEPPRAGLPDVFAAHAESFPRRGHALELACGTGGISVWLAERGLDVLGVDVSLVAIDRALVLGRAHGVACRFAVVDLDQGLPPGPPAAVIVCHMFRDPRLDEAIIDRLAPGGIIAAACLSEVGAGPGRFRARPGELQRVFASLSAIDAGESEGRAWILARKGG